MLSFACSTAASSSSSSGSSPSAALCKQLGAPSAACSWIIAEFCVAFSVRTVVSESIPANDDLQPVSLSSISLQVSNVRGGRAGEMDITFTLRSMFPTTPRPLVESGAGAAEAPPSMLCVPVLSTVPKAVLDPPAAGPTSRSGSWGILPRRNGLTVGCAGDMRILRRAGMLAASCAGAEATARCGDMLC